MEPEKKEEEKNLIKSLRTYQGDVEEAMQKNRTSSADVFVAEQKRKIAAPREEVPRQSFWRNKTMAIIAILFLLVGVVSIAGVYYLKQNERVTVTKQSKTIIGFSSEKPVIADNLNKNQLETQIVKEVDAFRMPPNSILYLNLENSNGETTLVGNVFQNLFPNSPSQLIRALDSKYMFGVYSFDTNELFIILTVNDYANAYSGMLKWEPEMVSDFSSLFKIKSGDTDGIFADESLKNKDLRILVDVNKKTILSYSFLDRNTIVITTNENILTSVLGKYLISKEVR